MFMNNDYKSIPTLWLYYLLYILLLCHICSEYTYMVISIDYITWVLLACANKHRVPCKSGLEAGFHN